MWKQKNREPAWVAITELPHAEFKPAFGAEKQALERFFSPDIVVDLAERLYLGERFLDMYRVRGYDDSNGWLVKWLHPERYHESAKSYCLIQWLIKQDILTPEPAFEPRRVGAVKHVWDQGVLWAVRYHIHRFLRPDPEDLFALGRLLAKFHNALQRHPDRIHWKKETQQRIFCLSRVRTALANGDWTCKVKNRDVREIAEDSTLDFERLDLPRQPLHGDANLTNFLMTNRGLMVIDFEDVHHSFLPLEFELAYALERLVMVHPLPDQVMIQLGSALLRGYFNSATTTRSINSEDWVPVIKSLNLRSLCVLALIENQGGHVPQGEWNKFHYLFRRADIQAGIWRSLRL